jgi:hypothetical protein
MKALTSTKNFEKDYDKELHREYDKYLIYVRKHRDKILKKKT